MNSNFITSIANNYPFGRIRFDKKFMSFIKVHFGAFDLTQKLRGVPDESVLSLINGS